MIVAYEFTQQLRMMALYQLQDGCVKLGHVELKTSAFEGAY